MSNIENIFADRRKKEQELKLTYSKYIFNSHLIMFLIIVLGAVLINYSKWIAVASQFELYSVFIAASLAFSYYLISTKIKTYIKEADAVFLLPLEKYYKNVGRKTVINVSVTHIIAFVIFYFAVKPITSIIGNIDKLSICLLLMVIVINNLLKYVQVIHYKEIIWIKILQFIVTFIQIIAVFIINTYIHIADMAGIISLAFCAYYVIKNSTGSKSSEDQEKLVVKWNEAAEYDKHRMESYLKFVNMFVDVPLSGVKVARRKYFDALLPKLTKDNFTKENSFKYYYYRVFLRQENTVFLALRLMLIAGIIIYSFNNVYVSLVVIISYSYLTIIQLVPLCKQISNNIWHSILPVNEEIKIKSFKNLLTAVILITIFILTLLSIVVSGIDYLIIGINILSFVLANLLARVFIAKVK